MYITLFLRELCVDSNTHELRKNIINKRVKDEMKGTNTLLLLDQRVGIIRVQDVMWVSMVKHLQVGAMSCVVLVVWRRGTDCNAM